jgi:hypothetical protein
MPTRAVDAMPWADVRHERSRPAASRAADASLSERDGRCLRAGAARFGAEILGGNHPGAYAVRAGSRNLRSLHPLSLFHLYWA